MGGSRVNPADYEAGPMESYAAGIAVDANNYYKKLEPLIVKDIQSATNLKVTQYAKGKAQADFGQTLTNDLNLKMEQDFAVSAARMFGAVQNQTRANQEGVKIQNQEIENALSIGLGNEATAAGAISDVARGETTTKLAKVQDVLSAKLAKDKMYGQAAAAVAKFATGNLASQFSANRMTGGSYTPTGNPFQRAVLQPGQNGGVDAYTTAFGPFGRS
tara:strand:- start:39 stop:689 length:651 start_codon:yes stop_codon:yes gene_type:complete